MDLFLVCIVALFLVVALAVMVATITLFAFLSLLLKGSTIVGVMGRILDMQKTVEFILSIVLVAVISKELLVPTGLIFVGQSLIGLFA